MSRLLLMISVTDRSRIGEYVGIYNENGVSLDLLTRGAGTANSEMEELFGLEGRESEKAVGFGVVAETVWKKIKRELENGVSTKEPWAGLP